MGRKRSPSKSQNIRPTPASQALPHPSPKSPNLSLPCPGEDPAAIARDVTAPEMSGQAS